MKSSTRLLTMRSVLYWSGMALLLLIVLIMGDLLFTYRADRPVSELTPRLVNATSRFVTLDGAQIHYRIEGNTADSNMPTVVLLHGTVSSLHTWDGWVAQFDNAARIVRLDLPGWGVTGPVADADYSARWYADFLARFLDAIHIPHATIIGNSLGGQIAWNFALAYPQRTDKLVLVDAAGYPFETGSTAHKLARNPYLSWMVRYFTPRFRVKMSIEQMYGDPHKVTPELVDRYYDLMLREGVREVFIKFLRLPRSGNYKRIPEIKAPTLIQWGGRDTWIPSDNARKFQHDIVGSLVRIYPTAGHVPMEELPRETAQDALAFVRGDLR